MTPTQWFALMLMAAGVWQLWLFHARPDDYFRLKQDRDERIKGVTKAGVSLARFLMKRK